MVRTALVISMLLITTMSCARTEKRGARYNGSACPICVTISDGTCSFCMGSKKCMFCDGLKERTEVSPNFSDEPMKPFAYKAPCIFCKASGVCTYCQGNGKCWACNGTQKVSPDWHCLNSRQQAAK